MQKKYYKYPRTPHLPFSLGMTSDDKVLKNTEHFQNKYVVVTEKMDGENTTIYRDYCHARSIDSKHKEYHSWLLQYIRNFQYMLDNDIRICGEYLYAKHSIKYNNLPSYFEVFSIWQNETCLSWQDTLELCELLNLIHVPVLYTGIYNDETIQNIAYQVMNRGGEGVVVRLMDSFNYDDFNKSIAKFVRPNHVQTNKHWSMEKIEKNNLL